jgi:hypothetical protein
MAKKFVFYTPDKKFSKHLDSLEDLTFFMKIYYENAQQNWEKALSTYSYLTSPQPTETVEAVWKPWQKRLLELLAEAPNPKTLLVVVDPEGQTGKTFFAQTYKLAFPEKTLILNCSKKFEIICITKQNPDKEIIFLDRNENEAKRKLHKNTHTTISEIEFQKPVHFVLFSNQHLNYNLLPNQNYHVMTLEKSKINSEINWTEHDHKKTFFVNFNCV